MSKTFKIYSILFLIIAILLAILQLNKKEITDWRKNFDTAEKSPFGLYVFNKEINKLLNNQVSKSNKSPYAFYSENPKIAAHNILIINQDLNKTTVDKILAQVNDGSDALIFSEDFPKYFQSQLQFLTTNVNDGDKNILKLTTPFGSFFLLI